MGYDMYLRDTTPEWELVKETAGLALTAGDPDLVRDAFEERMRVREEQKLYFRLNIWGMGEYRILMEELGMAYWPDSDQPDFPDPMLYNVPTITIGDGEHSYEDYDESSEYWAEWNAACDEVRAWSPDPQAGIALHKLCSNDGWWVTSEECTNSLRLYADADLTPLEDAVDQGFDVEYWQEWLGFLQRGADTDGFQVY